MNSDDRYRSRLRAKLKMDKKFYPLECVVQINLGRSL